MKYIFANDTYINVDQILWVESRRNEDDSKLVVTIQFQDKKLTWTGPMANEFMREWFAFVSPVEK